MRPQGLAKRGRTARTLRHALLDLVLLPAVLFVVLAEAVLWRGGRAAGRRLAPLLVLPAPVRDRIARLPGWAAVTLFLTPYLASRGGTVMSVVLLIEGQPLAAAAAYAASKLVALVLVLGIYRACEPKLLGVRWFARAHGKLLALRARALAGLRRGAAGLGGRRARRRRGARGPARRGALAARFLMLRRRLHAGWLG